MLQTIMFLKMLKMISSMKAATVIRIALRAPTMCWRVKLPADPRGDKPMSSAAQRMVKAKIIVETCRMINIMRGRNNSNLRIEKVRSEIPGQEVSSKNTMKNRKNIRSLKSCLTMNPGGLSHGKLSAMTKMKNTKNRRMGMTCLKIVTPNVA